MKKKASCVLTVLTQGLLLETLLFVMLLWGGRHPVAISALGLGTLAATLTWGLAFACRGRWVWRKAGGWWLFALALLLGILQLSPDFSSLMMTEELKSIYATIASTGLYQGDALLAVIPGV